MSLKTWSSSSIFTPIDSSSETMPLRILKWSEILVSSFICSVWNCSFKYTRFEAPVVWYNSSSSSQIAFAVDIPCTFVRTFLARPNYIALAALKSRSFQSSSLIVNLLVVLIVSSVMLIILSLPLGVWLPFNTLCNPDWIKVFLTCTCHKPKLIRPSNKILFPDIIAIIPVVGNVSTIKFP